MSSSNFRNYQLLAVLITLILLRLLFYLYTNLDSSYLSLIRFFPRANEIPVSVQTLGVGDVMYLEKKGYIMSSALSLSIKGLSAPSPEEIQSNITSNISSGPCTVKHINVSEHQFHMCLRRDSDVISDKIKSSGNHRGCQDLPFLWTTALSHGRGIFVDAGANIGFCSLEMASLGAEVIAIEPLEENIRYMRYSIALRENDAFRDRVKVLPIGLGNRTFSAELFTEQGNYGNSVVGTAVAERDAENVLSAMRNARSIVQLHSLDDLLWANRATGSPPPQINLLKLNVMGYELNVLDGAMSLIKGRAIKLMKVELIRKWLQAQGTTPYQVCDRISRQLNFTLLTPRGIVITSDHCRGYIKRSIVAKLI